MKVLVCGDRNWTNRERIYERLAHLPGGSIVIHGAARGADSIAGDVAGELGYEVERYPAQWDVYGRAAGPIRNMEMLDRKPELVIAFHNNISNSRGTAHCLKEAVRRGIPTELLGE